MPVIGAVVVLRSPGHLEALPEDPRLLVGVPTGANVPVALEVEDGEEADRFWNALLEHPDVLDVQLVFAHYEAATDSPAEEVSR